MPSSSTAAAPTDNTVAARAQRDVSMMGSPGLHDWLGQQQISLAFTTYQTNRLFLVGCKAQGGLAVNERLFDKPMGLYADAGNLVMACRYQIWQLENRLAAGETRRGCDRLYVPSLAYTTGDLNVHDVVLDGSGRLLFVNTDFSCLAVLRPGFSFEPVAFCPGFVRGLAFHGDYALVGLSKLRSKSFAGLGLETRLAEQGQPSQCGLMVVDLASGKVVHGLQIDGVVEELFDVVVLPGVRRPAALGFQDDDIDRLVSYPGSNGLVVTKPTVKRPGVGRPVQKAGLPRPAQNLRADEVDATDATDALAPSDAPIKYQQVFHLNPENLLPYEGMTHPSLRQRWQDQPQRGELLGVSASVAGDMVGLAVAEVFQAPDAQTVAELLSLKVSPSHADSGIDTALFAHLQKLVGRPLGR